MTEEAKKRVPTEYSRRTIDERSIVLKFLNFIYLHNIGRTLQILVGLRYLSQHFITDSFINI